MLFKKKKYVRYLCVLKTNDVAVSLKISTCTHISLNRVKGAPSGLMGDIVQYTSDLQVFELKHKSLPGDLKLKIKVWRLSLKMVCWLLILFTIRRSVRWFTRRHSYCYSSSVFLTILRRRQSIEKLGTV